MHYPGAVEDPDTGALISDAEVAETPYTLRLGSRRSLTVRLVVRRVKEPATPTRCFRCGAITRLSPLWLPPPSRHHPPKHAIIETTFADLIDGPLAHIPSGCSPPRAWLACAVITHNLLRAAGTLAGGHTPCPRATLRRDLVNVPARFAAAPANPSCTYPPLARQTRKTLWTTSSATTTRRPTPRRLPRPSPYLVCERSG